MRIAIAGATGNIGKKLVRELQDRGQRDLVLLCRDPSKLDEEKTRGGRIAHGDVTDPDFVKEALRGADALFWMVPPNMLVPNLRTYQDEIARIGATAAKANGVKHVVFLSSLGADQAEGVGPISGLHDAEEIFSVAVPGLTILRPASFMENFLMQADAIRQMSSIFMPVSGNRSIPMIATEDIAKAAADALMGPVPQGKRVVTLVGPKPYSFDEAASIIGEALGRPVRYVRVSDEEARDYFTNAGATADVANQMVEMYDAIDRGTLLQPPVPDAVTTPTTFEQFAQEVIRPAVGSSGERH